VEGVQGSAGGSGQCRGFGAVEGVQGSGRGSGQWKGFRAVQGFRAVEGVQGSGRGSGQWKGFRAVQGFQGSGRGSGQWKGFRAVQGFQGSGRGSGQWKGFRAVEGVQGSAGGSGQCRGFRAVHTGRQRGRQRAHLLYSGYCLYFSNSAAQSSLKWRQAPQTSNQSWRAPSAGARVTPPGPPWRTSRRAHPTATPPPPAAPRQCPAPGEIRGTDSHCSDFCPGHVGGARGRGAEVVETRRNAAPGPEGRRGRALRGSEGCCWQELLYPGCEKVSQ